MQHCSHICWAFISMCLYGPCTCLIYYLYNIGTVLQFSRVKGFYLMQFILENSLSGLTFFPCIGLDLSNKFRKKRASSHSPNRRTSVTPIGRCGAGASANHLSNCARVTRWMFGSCVTEIWVANKIINMYEKLECPLLGCFQQL